MLDILYHINWRAYMLKTLSRLGHFIGVILQFLFVSGILVRLGVNIYLAPLLAWMILIVLPKLRRPRVNVKEGMETFFKDKIRAKAFARTAVLIFLFSLLANNNLRLYFWIIAALDISIAGLIYLRIPRIAQT